MMAEATHQWLSSPSSVCPVAKAPAGFERKAEKEAFCPWTGLLGNKFSLNKYKLCKDWACEPLFLSERTRPNEFTSTRKLPYSSTRNTNHYEQEY